jgi:ferredoxin-NADP reductase
MATITMETLGVNSVTKPIIKPTDWRFATVTRIRVEAPGLRSYTFEFDEPVEHYAGQHYEIRLTAPDGYQAARLYSAAMPANGRGRTLELTIALMPHGEVSTYLYNNVKAGSQIELRGPLGNYFTWEPSQTEPILLVGGGVGVAPLRAIRLAHQQACADCPIRLLYSARSYADMAYKYELFPKGGKPAMDLTMAFTEVAPDGWDGYARRIDQVMINEVLKDFTDPPTCYVCGPTPMVEAVTTYLVKAGLDPNTIKAERFGSTEPHD